MVNSVGRVFMTCQKNVVNCLRIYQPVPSFISRVSKSIIVMIVSVWGLVLALPTSDDWLMGFVGFAK
jgi:hypothetical protein